VSCHLVGYLVNLCITAGGQRKGEGFYWHEDIKPLVKVS
jgi:hypothetical protein